MGLWGYGGCGAVGGLLPGLRGYGGCGVTEPCGYGVPPALWEPPPHGSVAGNPTATEPSAPTARCRGATFNPPPSAPPPARRRGLTEAPPPHPPHTPPGRGLRGARPPVRPRPPGRAEGGAGPRGAGPGGALGAPGAVEAVVGAVGAVRGRPRRRSPSPPAPLTCAALRRPSGPRTLPTLLRPPPLIGGRGAKSRPPLRLIGSRAPRGAGIRETLRRPIGERPRPIATVGQSPSGAAVPIGRRQPSGGPIGVAPSVAASRCCAPSWRTATERTGRPRRAGRGGAGGAG